MPSGGEILLNSINDLNHQKFQDHLRESANAVWFVARWIWNKGYAVIIPEFIIASGHGQWKECADEGDLQAWIEGEWKRIEVKELGICFTDQDDWPYPDFIVCAKHSYDRAEVKPSYYIILSHDRKAMGIIDTQDVQKWTVERRKDHRYEDIEQDFYICSLDDVNWRKIE